MFVNTEYFCEAANYFRKHGKYDCGNITTGKTYVDYWDREIDRCLNGYTVSGIRITGYHYFYLNYNPIVLVKVSEENKKKDASLSRIKGERMTDFPRFWDVDYEYFHAIERCELEGKHLVVLKPRGIGASFKGAALVARNFFLIRNSRNYLLANEKEFLLKDGIFNKFLDSKDFNNKNCAWFKYTDVKNDLSEMHIKASHRDIYGNEIGYKSEVIGVTLKNDYQKARGKRGKIILWEELGKFPNADKAWNIARPSVEEGDVTFGIMLGFGTGGTDKADFESLEKLFYNPDSYNCLAFDNIWDEGLSNTKCGFFIPAFKDIGFIDKEGNSLIEKAKDYYDKQREIARKSPDHTLLDQIKAEKPYCPSEATLNINDNIFPVSDLKIWKNNLEITGKSRNLTLTGFFTREATGKLKFNPDNSLVPLMDYPIKKNKDNTGCIVVYDPPYERGEHGIPKHLYIVVIDTYAHATSSGDSVGACYVLKNINNISRPADIIAASYIGRPKDIDDFNRRVFELAEFYNAKIGIENDRAEDFIGYAKRIKRLHWLQEEFELGFNASIPKSGVRRSYGMHIGSGRENMRKKIGDNYIKEWLLTSRGVTEDEMQIYNYHMIYDVGLLQELISYKPDGNFDRISALRIGMFMFREITYRNELPMLKKFEEDDFFNRVLFA
jgi:hypothetical protein